MGKIEQWGMNNTVSFLHRWVRAPEQPKRGAIWAIQNLNSKLEKLFAVINHIEYHNSHSWPIWQFVSYCNKW